MPTLEKSSNSFFNPGKLLIIFCLVMAGEMIFGLPFHVVRYFRPTVMAVFGLNNAELGDAMAVYGVTAMLSYFPGGVIADRFSARKLMSISLIATGIGGVYLATIPGQLGLSLVFGYWGITTILLFWSAMMKTTREWGGSMAQGRAFGFLDGGRGLIAAGVATVAVFILKALLPTDLENTTPEEQAGALKGIIYFYSFMSIGTAALIWFSIPDKKLESQNSNTFSGVLNVLTNKSAWLQALIVVCAYCGYRGLDFYSLYGIDVLGMDEVSSARFVSNAAYLRAFGAIMAGFLADKLTTKKVLAATFILLITSYIVLSFVDPSTGLRGMIFANLLFTFLAVYALRGIYFALFEEMNIKGSHTGTTVGLVSVVGYTPDIFFNSVGGRILDASPGINGYQNFYLFLGVFALVGLLATLLLARRILKSKSI